MRWECTYGCASGEGFPLSADIHDDPECEGRLQIVLDGVSDTELALAMHRALTDRAHSVAGILDYGSETLKFDDADFDDPKSEFSTSWVETWAYGGREHHHEYIPTRYLAMPDEDIKAELQAKAGAEAALARQQAIRHAEAVADKARLAAASAAETAERALAEAEANLAALRGA